MSTYTLPPGAWLSGPAAVWTRTHGANGSSNQPFLAPWSSLMPQPPRTGSMPVPPVKATMPVPPLRVAKMPEWMPEWMPVPPASQESPAPHGALTSPWVGIDPSWVYTSGPDSLLAQGLRRTRNKIAPALDPRRPVAAAGKVLPTAQGLALWRWQRAYRVKAVVAELLGRLVVEGADLWWVSPPSSAAAAQHLFALPDLVGFDWSEQIDKVLRAAVEREERLPEILSQMGDISPYFEAISGIDPDNTPRLSELLEVACEVATHVVMALKNEAAVWRPYQMSSAIHPVISTPGHGALPSGHATIATLTACLYAQLLPAPSRTRVEQLDRLARRIAFNRVVAGVHFPIDSEVGYALGAQIAIALVAAAAGSAAPAAYAARNAADSSLREIVKVGGFSAPVQARTAAAVAAKTTGKPVARNVRALAQLPAHATPLLAALWRAAADEMKLRAV